MHSYLASVQEDSDSGDDVPLAGGPRTALGQKPTEPIGGDGGGDKDGNDEDGKNASPSVQSSSRKGDGDEDDDDECC